MVVVATKRKSKAASSMKFRPTKELGRDNFKGTKPLAERASVEHILFMTAVQLCRKVMYIFDIPARVAVYFLCVLILSVGGPSSRPLSPVSDFINTYFVKFGWGWTFLLTAPFAWLVGRASGCGRPEHVTPNLSRFAAATAVWYFVTGFFLTVENATGVCAASHKFLSKSECAQAGFRWSGFDISGHSFLLVWNNLFILEEAKAYLGWERIKEMIRNEEHNRLETDAEVKRDQKATPLTKLSLEEFLDLRGNYKRLTPYIRALFCLMALVTILWDAMLVSTALYFHSLVEKVAGVTTAVLCWFVLYRVVYPRLDASPGNTGAFKYVVPVKNGPATVAPKERKPQETRSWTDQDKIPKFMGMPLYNYGRDLNKEAAESANKNPPLTRSSSLDMPIKKTPSRRSRSISKTRLNANSVMSLNLKYS